MCAVLGLTALIATALPAVATAEASPNAASVPIHWGFENDSLDGWTVEPGANLGPLITDRDLYHNQPTVTYNKEGKYFLSTLETPSGDPNDGYTGVVDSPTFTLTKPTITMLVGGGNSANTYVAACLPSTTAANGCQVLGKAQGENAEPLQTRQLDLSDYVGKQLFLQVVDQSTGAWGHVTLDDVRINSVPEPTSLTASRSKQAVRLTWPAVDDPDLAGYLLYRSTDEVTGYVPLTSTPLTATSYTDRSAASSKPYYYRVTALADDGTESDQRTTTYAPAYENVYATGSTVTYSGKDLTGIEFPVGPIGAGGILHFGDGTRNESWIFNHDDTFQPRTQGDVPNSFFAVRTKVGSADPVVRALQTKSEGAFTGMKSLTFQGEYPLAHYAYKDNTLPVQVSENVSNPTVPGDLKRSAIPTAIYKFTLRNSGNRSVSVSLLAAQQNAVGFDGVGTITGDNNDSFSGYGSNTNKVRLAKHAGRLLMTGDKGSMALSVGGSGKVTGTADWTNNDALRTQLATTGEASGRRTASSPAAGSTVDGALASTVTLRPGKQVTIPVVLSWNFPTNPTRGFGGEGEQYTNWWPTAASVDRYVTTNLADLTARTQQFHDTMYDSNLPHYILDRLTSGISVLHTPAVFWGSNGFFGGWEGYGCCWGMPTHVWHYAQTAAALWPQIGRLWVDQWLGDQQPDGMIPYRFDAPGQTYGEAFDGQAGVVLSAYRAYLQGDDASWLDKMWPKVKAAMDYLITAHDPDKDGLLTGAQPTTLDSSESGTGSWLGSLYLAAVNATAHMATVVQDKADSLTYKKLYNSGRANQEKLLWNGSYYIEKPQTLPGTVAYGDGSEIDMLLGQWWSTQLGLGEIYNAKHMKTAEASLFANNYKSSFYGVAHQWRDFVEPTQAGMEMITWPKGDQPANATSYWDETMTGFEYAAAATMIQQGLLTDGLTVSKAVSDRYDGRLQNDLSGGGCAAGDGGGNPFGDVECGQWYSRSMSSWSLLTALQGATYDGPAHEIGFAPQWRPADHRSFFTAGTSYGTFAQRRRGGTQTDSISVVSGRLDLKEVTLVVAGSGIRKVKATVDHHKVAATIAAIRGTHVTVSVASSALRSGSTMSLTLSR